MYLFIPYWVEVPIKCKMLPNYDKETPKRPTFSKLGTLGVQPSSWANTRYQNFHKTHTITTRMRTIPTITPIVIALLKHEPE